MAISSPVLRPPVPVLDTRACSELGGLLAGTREDRGIDEATVCAALLLSVSQVRALERAELTPFYNASFYLAALRKYVAYLGLPVDLADRVATDPPSAEEHEAARRAPTLVTRLRASLFGA